MMVIKNLSSAVDLERGESQHSMVVGLLEGGALEIPIDALTYGQLVGAFEQLHLQTELSSGAEPPTVEDVRQQVETRLGHQLAPGPIPKDEVEAAEQLRQLEQQHMNQDDAAKALLESVGFFPDSEDSVELDALAVTGTESDEDDPGERFDVVEDNLEAF